MSEQHIRAIIWDMGGVILRTSDIEPRTRLAQRFGLTLKELENLVFESETARLASVGAIRLLDHQKLVASALDLSVENIQDFFDEFFIADRVDHHLLALIRSLRPQYKTGLLSNAWEDARKTLEKHFHIDDVFDVSIFSSEVGLSKPDARIYRLILDRLKVTPAQAVFIDDFPVNVQAARSAGLHAIQFLDSNQAQTDLLYLLGQADD